MRKWFICVLPAMVLLTAACVDPYVLETKESYLSGEEGSYGFDSQTVLHALAQGNTNIFTPEATTTGLPQPDVPPVQWSQADFYRVAEAFHEFMWQDPMERWHLHRLAFTVECEDAPFGPQSVSLTLFRTLRIRQDRANTRFERYIYVEPRANEISWIEASYFPDIFSMSSVDPVQIRIPAEQALQIAESQGGREARLAAENNCTIFGSLVGGVRRDVGKSDWLIRYSGEGESLPFEITIDEQTGEYEVTYSKTK